MNTLSYPQTAYKVIGVQCCVYLKSMVLQNKSTHLKIKHPKENSILEEKKCVGATHIVSLMTINISGVGKALEHAHKGQL
jgi:hypothetical protein